MRRITSAFLAVAAAAFCAASSPMQCQETLVVALDEARLTSTGSEQYRAAVAAYLQRKESKIVPGRLAADAAYPWQVSLGVSWIADPFRAHFCGGSIYSSKWIVTAAHCVVDTGPEMISVVTGTNHLRPETKRVNVSRRFVHKNYSKATQDNDIALLELVEPLTFDKRTTAIHLLNPEEEATLVGRETVFAIVGWGATNEGGQPVADLRFEEVPLVPNDECNRPLAYNGQITQNMICAGKAIGGKDSCQGDSGGPLSLVKPAPSLAGIVSWGEGCARPNKVGVYTRVARYAAWVEKCTQKPASCYD